MGDHHSGRDVGKQHSCPAPCGTGGTGNYKATLLHRCLSQEAVIPALGCLRQHPCCRLLVLVLRYRNPFSSSLGQHSQMRKCSTFLDLHDVPSLLPWASLHFGCNNLPCMTFFFFSFQITKRQLQLLREQVKQR